MFGTVAKHFASTGFSSSTGLVLYQQQRGMSNLKAIALRLKSVKNMEKITQSMKMVSAAKYTRAEKDLKSARPYGIGAKSFYKSADISVEESKEPKVLYVALTSDRGLCGSVHTSICKKIRLALGEMGNIDSAKVLCVGDKSRAQIARTNAKQILAVGNEFGRLPPQFGDASRVANYIINGDFEYDVIKIFYNEFKTVVSYQTSNLNAFSLNVVEGAEKLSIYDSIDSNVLQSYVEYSLASLIYYCMKEGACSEQSSRMTAMDNSSKNAAEMIGKLTLSYNRTRQSVITGELIEIISGAAAAV